jgi:hypothetical protein
MIFQTPLVHEILFAVRCFHFVVNILVPSLLLFPCVFVRSFLRYYNLFKIIHVVSSVKFTFILLQRLLTEDCRQHLTAEAEVRPQTSPYRIYFGQSAVGQDRFLSGYFGFRLSVSLEHCSTIAHSSRPLHNAGNRQRSYITYLTNTVSVGNPCNENQLQFHPNPVNRQSTKKHNTHQLYIYSIPPDDGLQICPKHVEVY